MKVFNPARAAKFPGRVCAHKKRCAAQAEYLRLAAQAYSPSDAMSQARNRSGPNEKGSTPPRDICRAVCRLKRRPCGGRSCQRGRGGPPDFPRHRRPRCIAPCGGVVWLARLFLAGWIRLPWRHVGSRRRIRPDRLWQPRGLRSAAETQQPCEKIGAMLSKHWQNRFVGDDNLYMHAAKLARRS